MSNTLLMTDGARFFRTLPFFQWPSKDGPRISSCELRFVLPPRSSQVKTTTAGKSPATRRTGELGSFAGSEARPRDAGKPKRK